MSDNDHVHGQLSSTDDQERAGAPSSPDVDLPLSKTRAGVMSQHSGALDR